MSLFRKPTKKIQRRVFGCVDEDEDGEPDPPPPPVISRQKKENKPAKSTPALSFVDEEEEVEVFKVKKSSQSKRLAKKREKERRHQTGDSNYENNAMEEDQQPNTNDEPESAAKPKKKVTLEGLILSGREALAADGTGDLSDDEAEPQEEEEQGGFHRYRAESVRAALAADVIPDAALIHAARKTRQQARELGGDYVSIRSDSDRGKAPPGSRLVRDDDGSDDEEGRVHVRGLDLPSDKPKRGTTAAPTDAELDSAGEEWEEQQMQKAVAIDIAGQRADDSVDSRSNFTVWNFKHKRDNKGSNKGESSIEVNPFAMAPPPPRLDDGPPHLRPLVSAGNAPTSARELVDALSVRLQELQISRATAEQRRSELQARLMAAARVREDRNQRCGPLAEAYTRAQAHRAYVTDLVECLDEKMPLLEALEARALAMHRKRCDFIQERRRADVRDQAQDVLALAARPGTSRPPEPEDKIRRCAEREGRRRARRLKREAARAQHRDGDSSDDELPPADALLERNEREAIRALSASLFSDALPAWRSVRGVCARMARWRRRDPAAYSDAYVAACLPRLLAPYVRHELLLWNPLADEDNEDYERMDWYKCLMMYGVRSQRLSSDSEASDDEEESQVTEDSTRSDPDLNLVPSILQRVVVPKLTELVEHAWDPVMVRSCVRLRGVLARLALLPPRGATPLQRLSRAAHARLHACLAHDVFLPALPPQIMDGGGGSFWRRCLGAGVRLLRAILALCPPPDALRADPLALQLIGTLCTAAGAAPARQCAGAAAALACTLPREGTLRARALARLATLAQRALDQLSGDNPDHLKAIEQARSVLAEAKACEKQT